MGRLDDKVAVITASGSGIGRAGALLFAKEGAKVVIASRGAENGQEVADNIRDNGGEAIFVKTDVTKLPDMDRLIKATVASYGKLNILWNNAGGPAPFFVENVEEVDWYRAVDLNIKSAFFMTKYALPEIRNAGGGSIIFTSSIAGLAGSRSQPTYCLLKGGIVNLTRSLAVALADDNIRVNCICPSGVDTPMSPYFSPPGGTLEERRAAAIAGNRKTPLGHRMARPEEIAYAALFFASEESSFVTGQILAVDGGTTAALPSALRDG